MPVSAGSTIVVPNNTLGGTNGKKITAKWSQNLATRTQDYWVAKFTNKESGETDVIFVQVDWLEKLKSKARSDEYTFVIDGDFQYGQQKDGSNRFVVYQDKNNKVYQHRFVENMYTSLGSSAADIFSALGFSGAGQAGDLAKNFIGDYLRNF